MVERVVNASERGADIRGITSRDSNNVPGQYALLSQYERVIDADIEIYEVPGTVHAKVTVADDTLIIGSINYDAWGLNRNLELTLMFEDADLADEAISWLVEPVVAQGVLVEPPDAGGKPFLPIFGGYSSTSCKRVRRRRNCAWRDIHLTLQPCIT